MDFSSILGWAVGGLGAVVFSLVVIGIGQLVAKLLRHRRPGLTRGWQMVRLPLGLALLFSALRLTWRDPNEVAVDHLATIQHILLIGAIVSWVWLAGAVVLTLIDAGLRRTPAWVNKAGNQRRVVTQLLLVRRLVVLVFVILGIGGVLLTFPGVDRLGGGILASAGLLSVIAGLAAQTSLANLFAGIQLTFSEALRIGDTVVVQDEYGEVEEITLTYVVIRIWDDRRLVLPTTYFATTPYTNWTRQGSEITGTVFLTVDWRIDLAALRAHLSEFLETRPDWNGRSGGVIVSDATGGNLELRVAVSADNADALWDLRCAIREDLVQWIQASDPDGIPGHRLRPMPSTDPAVDQALTQPDE